MYTLPLTLITPSFNQGRFIEQTIQSVLDQGYPNLQYIIIDGGSTDNTIEIIKKYDKYISYWVSEKDNGQSHAINTGLKIATGEIINWLNSDDYLEPGALLQIASYFEDPGIKVVCGRSRVFSEDGKINFFSTGTDIFHNNLAKTIGWARIDQPETFFRKSAIDQIGFLNEKLHYVMDKEWWIRYLLNFGLDNIYVTDGIFVNFRLHTNSKTVSQKTGFEEETNSLYYNLAHICNLELEKQVIEKIGSYELLLDENLYQNTNEEIIKKSLNYYLLHKANESYYLDDWKKAQFILNKTNKSFLFPPDIKLWNNLRWRMKFPSWLINFARKINNNL